LQEAQLLLLQQVALGRLCRSAEQRAMLAHDLRLGGGSSGSGSGSDVGGQVAAAPAQLAQAAVAGGTCATWCVVCAALFALRRDSELCAAVDALCANATACRAIAVEVNMRVLTVVRMPYPSHMHALDGRHIDLAKRLPVVHAVVLHAWTERGL
jgi:hypothetical protein